MTSPPRLTDTQLASFERDGFLRIDALTDTAEVEVLLGLYDELFRRDGGFDSGDRIELNADVAAAPLPQIVNPERYAPRLVQGCAYRNAQAIARQLLGAGCAPTGNHAILKHLNIFSSKLWEARPILIDIGRLKRLAEVLHGVNQTGGNPHRIEIGVEAKTWLGKDFAK